MVGATPKVESTATLWDNVDRDPETGQLLPMLTLVVQVRSRKGTRSVTLKKKVSPSIVENQEPFVLLKLRLMRMRAGFQFYDKYGSWPKRFQATLVDRTGAVLRTWYLGDL